MILDLGISSQYWLRPKLVGKNNIYQSNTNYNINYDLHISINYLPPHNNITEKNPGICEEDIEDSVADLHCWAQHNRHILQTHLILLLLRTNTIIVDNNRNYTETTTVRNVTFPY